MRTDDYIYQRELGIENSVGMLADLGSVSEVFRSGRIAIVKFKGHIAVSDRVLLFRGERQSLVRVSSLQLNGEDRSEIKSSDEIEIGIMGTKFQVGDRLLRSSI